MQDFLNYGVDSKIPPHIISQMVWCHDYPANMAHWFSPLCVNIDNDNRFFTDKATEHAMGQTDRILNSSR